MPLMLTQLKTVQMDKDRSIAESRARESVAAERARLLAAVDDHRKEAAVQKALSEGWSRDLKVCSSDVQRYESMTVILVSCPAAQTPGIVMHDHDQDCCTQVLRNMLLLINPTLQEL